MKLFFAGNLLGVIKLPANLMRFIEQMHFMTALSSIDAKCQARRARTDNGNSFALLCRGKIKLSFITGARVNQTTGALILKHMIKARLITGNTGIDEPSLVCRGFIDKLGIG